MANRAYLYSLSNRPRSYADRPERIVGLSEWGWQVPLSYRVLMSGSPQICASLAASGLESDAGGAKTKLHAISSDFQTGYARLEKLAAAVRHVAARSVPGLDADLTSTFAFLESHRDEFLLLETIELDMVTETDEEGLRACVEREVAACLQTGSAVDALPADPAEAGARLLTATRSRGEPPWDAFHGLRLDENYDAVRETDYPLGLYWEDVLYFALWNRAEFIANGLVPDP
jgi:hypothetical protein